MDGGRGLAAGSVGGVLDLLVGAEATGQTTSLLAVIQGVRGRERCGEREESETVIHTYRQADRQTDRGMAVG